MEVVQHLALLIIAQRTIKCVFFGHLACQIHPNGHDNCITVQNYHREKLFTIGSLLLCLLFALW